MDDKEAAPVAVKKKKKGRVNGFTTPLEKQEVLTWLAHFFVISGFLGIFCSIILPDFDIQPNQQFLPFVIVYYISLGVLLISYVYTQAVDPASTDNVFFVCSPAGRNNEQEKRYCSVCKKSVPGLDHHCVWLGTCVGRKNYLSFYVLVVTGFCTFLMQAIGLLFLLIRETSTGKTLVPTEEVFVFVVTIAWLLASALLAARYLNLALYHTFLIYKGRGTYDFMLYQRNQLVARSRA